MSKIVRGGLRVFPIGWDDMRVRITQR